MMRWSPAVLLLATVACQVPKPKGLTPSADSIRGVPFEVVELAAGRAHAVSPEGRVDARSRLVVRFDVRPNEEPVPNPLTADGESETDPAAADAEEERAPVDTGNLGPMNQRWLLINRWLREVATLEEDRAAFVSALTRNSEEESVASFQRRANNFNARVDDLTETGEGFLAPLYPNEDELDQVLFGSDEELTNLGALSRWCVGECSRLLREIDRTLADSRYEMMVVAFSQSPGKPRKRIHVENFDRIDSGSTGENIQTGFGLTPVKLAQLREELRQAERAAAVLRGLEEDVENFGEDLKLLLRRMRVDLRALVDQLESADWEQQVNDARSRLSALPARNPGESRALDALESLLESAVNTQESLRGLRDDIDKLRAPDGLEALLSLLSTQGGLQQSVTQLFGKLKTLSEAVRAGWQALEDLSEEIPTLGQRAAGEGPEADKARAELQSLAQVFPEELREGVRKFLDPLREAVEKVTEVAGPLGNALGGVSAAEEALQNSVDLELDRPRKLDDLEDGTIELRGSVAPGDVIRLEVQLRDPKLSEPVVAAKRYRLEVTRYGWRTETHGEAIFARGLDGGGSAEDWKANVGAMHTWHLRNRYPNGWGSFLNWLDPGAGLQVASLDQDEDAGVEFGVGGALRFWDGLFFAGYGFNLSADGDEYVFLGTSLFKLLGVLTSDDE